MEIVLMLLCIAGLSYALKELEGPFGLFSKARNLLMRLPLVGTMLFQLLGCNFCVGFWASLGLYVLTNSFNSLSVGDLLVWAFGGATFNALFWSMMDKLNLK